jgi:hypothetical protein
MSRLKSQKYSFLNFTKSKLARISLFEKVKLYSILAYFRMQNIPDKTFVPERTKCGLTTMRPFLSLTIYTVACLLSLFTRIELAGAGSTNT